MMRRTHAELVLHRFQGDRRSGRARALHEHDVQDGEERQPGVEERGRLRPDARLQLHHPHAAGGGARLLLGVNGLKRADE